ncbi:hypothetical protein GMMP15_680018 [Candidatus Magnetomoraceae bacterium gMMP-15]
MGMNQLRKSLSKGPKKKSEEIPPVHAGVEKNIRNVVAKIIKVRREN